MFLKQFAISYDLTFTLGKQRLCFLLLCIVVLLAQSNCKFAAVHCLQNHIKAILCVGKVHDGFRQWFRQYRPFFFFCEIYPFVVNI